MKLITTKPKCNDQPVVTAAESRLIERIRRLDPLDQVFINSWVDLANIRKPALRLVAGAA